MKTRQSAATPATSSARIVVASGGHTATAPATNLVPLKLKLKRLLVPFDFSKHAEKALTHALAIAQQFGAELILVNVIEPFSDPGDFSRLPLPSEAHATERQKENLARLRSLKAGAGVKVEAVVAIGRPWEEIVRMAAAEHVDLIVISTHGYTGLKHVFLGSVAERVIRHATCPVLTIRPAASDLG
jgi:nucleotide-binding universal stress UspA family protein